MKMKLKYIVLILITISFVYAQDCKNNVNIKIDDDDASIYLNEKLVGTGSVSIELEKGEYDLFIREAGLSWDAKSIKENILIEDCGEAYDFSFSFKEKIFFDTSPQDVYVFNGDSLLGYSPMFIPKGITDINLSKPYYDSKSIQLNYGEVNNPVKLDFNGIKKSQRFVDTPWFKAMIGSAVVLGGIAAYYKIQADQSFEKYEESNRQSHLDDTDKFDFISGFAFGALQINFAALIYLVLTDK